jgi:hypothetical protein
MDRHTTKYKKSETLMIVEYCDLSEYAVQVFHDVWYRVVRHILRLRNK